jgi:F0F1-type ATP synthase membrane subunit c/vacuolar-type H+-ATPase subunit K
MIEAPSWVLVLVGLIALLVSAGLGLPLTTWVLGRAARSDDAGGVAGRERSGPAVGQPALAGPDQAAASPDAPDGTVPDPASGPDAAPDGTVPDPASGPDTAPDGPTGTRARDALRGGTWIGILERLAITGCLIAGYPAGIAFVIAVKGLGRYPELKENPGASERFVIGTLASMLWAVAVGALARHLLA